jgi:hypothetical protein
LATPQELDQWLQEGIIAAKAGQVEEARFRLLDVVEQQQTNEAAWYWLYYVFDKVEDKRTCLENLVIINPHNRWAKQELLAYLGGPAANSSAVVSAPAQPSAEGKEVRSAQKRPVALYLVSAFWIGISLVFMASGIFTAAEWLVSSPTNMDIFGYLRFLQPLIAVMFIGAGLFGLFVAISLLFRSMFGFYGSLILALGLLLIGPTMSLFASPPNYLALICTGGISGMIVMLTLANQAAFESFTQNDIPAS